MDPSRKSFAIFLPMGKLSVLTVNSFLLIQNKFSALLYWCHALDSKLQRWIKREAVREGIPKIELGLYFFRKTKYFFILMNAFSLRETLKNLNVYFFLI